MLNRAAHDPVTDLVEMIRFAVTEPVQSAGGSDRDIERIAVAAAYAAWCWGSSGAGLDTIPPGMHLHPESA